MGNNRTFATIVACIAVAVGLAGCAGTPTPAATPTPTQLGKVSTIEELRDAFIDAGGVCNWKQDDRVFDTTASGTCSDQTVLMLFADEDDLAKVVERIGGASIVEVNLLVGENWIINSSEAMDMQDELGGKIIQHDAQ